MPSTKRSVSRSWSASDNLFSIPRHSLPMIRVDSQSGWWSQRPGWIRRSGPTACRYRRRRGQSGPPANHASGYAPLRQESRAWSQARHGRAATFPVIGYLAGVQTLDGGLAMRHLAHLEVAGGGIEHALIFGAARASGPRDWAAGPTIPEAPSSATSPELRHWCISHRRRWFCSVHQFPDRGAQRPWCRRCRRSPARRGGDLRELAGVRR